jgi:hypothetical protein
MRPATPYVYTDNSEFFPGVINPLNTRIITKILTIDTKFRDNFFSTTCSDFTIQLPERINKVVSMQLSSIEIPVAFYGISSSYGNNYFYLQVHFNNNTENVCETFFIPDGNYTSNCLIETINTVLKKSKCAIFANIQFYIDCDTTCSDGKVLISTIGPDGCSPCTDINTITLDFSRNNNGDPDNLSPLSTKLGWALGFKNTVYSGSNIYISDTIIEPFPIRYIYLSVNDFNKSMNNNYITAFNKSVFNADILARISLKTPYFSLLYENNGKIISEPRKYFGPVDLQRMQIRMYDDHGRILNMNNSDFSFSLTLKTLYDL